MSQFDYDGDGSAKAHTSRIRYVVLLLLPVLLVAEEARYGYMLGLSGVFCNASGGNYAPAMGPTGRCISRLCYWFNDCGFATYPTIFRDRVAPGDSIAATVFLLGNPYLIEGDTFYWAFGKGSGADHFFSTTFRNGRFVAWNADDDATNCDDDSKLSPFIRRVCAWRRSIH